MRVVPGRQLAIGLLVSFSAAACGELGTSQASPSAITITLTDTECTAQGLGALLPRQLTATLVNRTSGRAFFVFKQLIEGHAYAELELHIQQRKQRIAVSGPNIEDPPPMAIDVKWMNVSPQQTDVLGGTLLTGTYGIVCRRDGTTTNLAEAIYILGPFRVM
jgi:hypothetical protein